MRVAHFFTTGSFFYDEACIALNLVTRHPGQLLEPLAYNQAAAPGFLFLEKCLIHFFGTSELVFRLPALLSSIAVLILLAIFCEKLFNRSLAIFAVAILAVSPLAITMASELKPYSTDAAFTLWMMIRFRSLFLNPTSRKQWLLFFLPGVLALLFSQTIIFVLLSLGLLLIVINFRERRSAVEASFMVAIWSGIFLILYFTIYRFEGNTFYMQTFWSANILSILKPQFAARAMTALSNLFPLSLDSIARLHERGLILISALGLYFTARRVGVTWAAALALPYAAVILASTLGLFPIAPRLLLFIIPLLVVLAAAGLGALAKALPPRFYALCCGLAVFLLIGNGTRLTYAQQRDHFPRLSKSLISQVEAAPDCAAVYVFADSVPAWDFYTRDVGIEGMPSQEIYQRVFDRDSDRVFAENPKPPPPEALKVYRLGCKAVIFGELRLRGIGDSGLRQAWARSELIRMKNSGASSAYIFGELYWRDDLEALLNEARSMGASAKTLGGGRPFLGYLGKIEFASNEKVVSPLQPNE